MAKQKTLDEPNFREVRIVPAFFSFLKDTSTGTELRSLQTKIYAQKPEINEIILDNYKWVH